jgi:hypothetical protein
MGAGFGLRPCFFGLCGPGDKPFLRSSPPSLALDSFLKKMNTSGGKGRRSMVRFEQIGMRDRLADAAGGNFRFPVSSKTKAKTTTKTV